MNYNRIQNIIPGQLPGSLTTLNAWGNQLTDASFLKTLPNLESLYLDQNKLSSLEDFPVLRRLTDLSLSENQIFMIGNSLLVHELFPKLVFLNLSKNSLYDRVELLTLSEVPSLLELDLSGNPCAESPEFEARVLEDYPQVIAVNQKYVEKDTQ